MRKTRMKMLMFGTDDDYVDTDNDIDDDDYHAYDQENVQYTAKIGFPPVSFAGFI